MKKNDLLVARVMSNLEIDKMDTEDKYYSMLTNGAENKTEEMIISKLKLSNIMFKFYEIEIPSLFKYIKDNIINADIVKTNDIMYICGTMLGLMKMFKYGSGMYEILDKINNTLENFHNYSGIDTRINKPTKEELKELMLKFSRLVDLAAEKEMPEIALLKESFKGLKLFNPFINNVALITLENIPEKYKNMDQSVIKQIILTAFRGQTDNNAVNIKFMSFDELLEGCDD